MQHRRTDWATGPVPSHVVVCHTWELTDLRQLSAVRRHARELLAGEAAADETGTEAVDRAVLVLDELASNALRHGQLPASLQLCDQGTTWLVIASDAAHHRVPVPAYDRPAGRGGYGLHVVTDLALSRGTTVQPPRKHVWAQLPKV